MLLNDIELILTGKVPKVRNPLFTDDAWQVNGREISFYSQGVGSFYASEGYRVEYCPEKNADPGWVDLVLNSLVLVALLHQRKIINFHASSIIYNGMGVMITGRTGSGKSSLTAAFALSGAGFLSDDLTAVIFNDFRPVIKPMFRRIKLREDSVSKLGLPGNMITMAEKGTGKYYFKVEADGLNDRTTVTKLPSGFPAALQSSTRPHYQPEKNLDIIVVLETGDVKKPVFTVPPASEKFELLRSEVCSWEILTGMPGVEAEYLKQIVKIAEKAEMVKVVRPEGIGVWELYEEMRRVLA